MPKIIGDSLADHRELTRNRLFDALASLLAEQPFDSISMSQIATRAKVGRTAVYNHFPDKEVLLLEFMRRVTLQFSQRLEEAIAQVNDPLAQLRIYIRAHLEMTTRYHLNSTFNLRTQVSRENSAHLHDHATIISTRLLEILGRCMESGAIPKQNPHALIPLIHSCLAGNRLPANPQQREATIATVQTFILRGVGADIPITSSAQRPSSVENASEDGADDRETDGDTAYMRCPVSA